MPLPKNRSRSVKRRKKGKKTLYKKRKVSKISCGLCKNLVKRKSKKPKKIARKFGHVLCNKCVRIVTNYSERLKNKTMKPEDLSLSHHKYVLV